MCVNPHGLDLNIPKANFEGKEIMISVLESIPNLIDMKATIFSIFLFYRINCQGEIECLTFLLYLLFRKNKPMGSSWIINIVNNKLSMV